MSVTTLTATSSTFGLSQIGQIAIPVKDLERAVACYRDQLGMKHLFSVPSLAFFDAGGVRLMLSRPEKPEFDHPSSILYYKVDDIHHACETLEARGWTPTIYGWLSSETQKTTCSRSWGRFRARRRVSS